MNKRMFNTLIHLHTIRVSSLVNRIFYYMQKLPLIGKLIHDRVYADLELKKVISVIATVLQIIWGLSKAFLFLGGMVFLPLSLVENTGDQQLVWMLHIVLWLSFIVAFISNSKVLEPTREKYVAVKQMRMSTTDYMQAYLTYRYITYAIYYIIPMIIFVNIAGGKAWQALLLVCTLTFWRIVSEVFHLKIYENTKLILIKENGFVWTIILIGFTIAYGILFTDVVPSYTQWLLNPIVSALIIIAGILAWRKLYYYNNFREIVDAATKHDDPLLNIGKMMSDVQKDSIKKETDKISIAQTQTLPAKIEQLKGYAYLHAIFMKRHRSLFTDKLKKRLLIIAAIGLLGIVLALLNPEQANTITTEGHSIVLLYLYIVISMFSVNSEAIYSFFYHCDVNIIGQSFYRQDAKQHYLIRLKMLMLHNGMIATALSFFITVIMYISAGWMPYEMSLMWFGAYAFSSFITVHQLFMYYMLQPYSADMKMKNPFYFFSNVLMSFLWFILLLFKVRGLAFVAIFAIAAIVYVIISTYVVRKFAHRTFRIK